MTDPLRGARFAEVSTPEPVRLLTDEERSLWRDTASTRGPIEADATVREYRLRLSPTVREQRVWADDDSGALSEHVAESARDGWRVVHFACSQCTIDREYKGEIDFTYAVVLERERPA